MPAPSRRLGTRSSTGLMGWLASATRIGTSRPPGRTLRSISKRQSAARSTSSSTKTRSTRQKSGSESLKSKFRKKKRSRRSNGHKPTWSRPARSSTRVGSSSSPNGRRWSARLPLRPSSPFALGSPVRSLSGALLPFARRTKSRTGAPAGGLRRTASFESAPSY